MKQPSHRFFSVRPQSVLIDTPLPYDLFLYVNDEYVLFRKVGDVVTSDRMVELLAFKLKEAFIPVEQREAHRSAMRAVMRNEDLKVEVRGVFIKESAFTHINDLFTKPDVSHLAQESVGLVEDMVHFISEDIEAAATLMKLSTHDYYTYNHSVNVSVYAIALCRQLYGNDKKLLMTAGLGGLLHDLGKRKIDPNVINKPGKLTPEEWVEMKKHPTWGVEQLQGIPGVPEEAKRIIHEHHEHMDGTGYPRGLNEDQISKLARIAAVADVFDALTTVRSYKEATTASEALQIMAGMKPGKFDSEIFTLLGKRIAAKEKVAVAEGSDPCHKDFTVKKAG